MLSQLAGCCKTTPTQATSLRILAEGKDAVKQPMRLRGLGCVHAVFFSSNMNIYYVSQTALCQLTVVLLGLYFITLFSYCEAAADQLIKVL